MTTTTFPTHPPLPLLPTHLRQFIRKRSLYILQEPPVHQDLSLHEVLLVSLDLVCEGGYGGEQGVVLLGVRGEASLGEGECEGGWMKGVRGRRWG
jgi:hypothetical protein